MSNAELLAAARAWCQANYPGCPLESISLTLRHLAVPIQLAEVPGFALTAAAMPPLDLEERGQGGLDRCTRDILAALRAAGGPLTKTRLLEVLDERHRRGEGGEWSESTVCRRLAALMADGTIENPEDARPRGYRMIQAD